MKFSYNYVYILFLIILCYGQIVGSENETTSPSETERTKSKPPPKKASTQKTRKHKHHHKISDSRKKNNLTQNINNHEISFSIDSLEDQIKKPENLSIKTLKINDSIKSSKAIELGSDVIDNFEKPVLLIDEHKSQEEVKKFKDGESKNDNGKDLNDINLVVDLSIIKNDTTTDGSEIKKKEKGKSLEILSDKKESLKLPILKGKEVLVDVDVVKNDFEKVINKTKDLDSKIDHKKKNDKKKNNTDSEVLFPSKLDTNLSKEDLKTSNSSNEDKTKVIDFEKVSNTTLVSDNIKNQKNTTEKSIENMFLNTTTVGNFTTTTIKTSTNNSANETTTSSTDILKTTKKIDEEVVVTTGGDSLNSSTSLISLNKTDTGILKNVSKSKEDDEKESSSEGKSKELEKEVIKEVMKQQKSTFFVVQIKNNKIVGEREFEDEVEAKRFLLTTLPPTTTSSPPTTTTHLIPPPTTIPIQTSSSSLVPKGMPPSIKPPNDEIIKKLNTAIDFITIAKELGIFHR